MRSHSNVKRNTKGRGDDNMRPLLCSPSRWGLLQTQWRWTRRCNWSGISWHRHSLSLLLHMLRDISDISWHLLITSRQHIMQHKTENVPKTWTIWTALRRDGETPAITEHLNLSLQVPGLYDLWWHMSSHVSATKVVAETQSSHSCLVIQAATSPAKQ